MTAVPPDGAGARDVLRAVRRAVEGAGPAVLLGAADPVQVPAGTAAVVTTSGSTGYPKSVLLSRSALTASAFATRDRIGEGAWLLALPAAYVAGLQVLVRSLMAGREPAVLEGRFSPSAFTAATRLMASSRGGDRIPTYTSLVPTQLIRLVEAAEQAGGADVRDALRSFEAILIGGQALPEPVHARAAALGARVVRTYGASETAGGCVYDGVPLDGVRMRIESGELQLAGPTLADGYLGDPERTDAAFARDDDGLRWYRTGDAAEISSGRLRVHGRLDNVIVSGGVNVSLDRVERIVRGLPGLAEAVVVGVPDDEWGEASVVVFAGDDDDDDGDDGALLRAVRDAVGAELGAPARPSRVRRVDALPTLSSGKPDRVALRHLAAG
ncbi:AMP-binding protein [Microbacterium sp. cx-59]|uniref:AMP-binding protein n=1 Tax=Microbacterium sp. cx-59 TaxID=2891207 RepID=UPI001E4C482C|nr:AMP-binding protein [Microbacterium sp. cx-59]MCC4909113.1 AMP-binding protein [Microbacterium sp. cx-59]